METDVALREASDDDAEELALLLRRVQTHAMPYLPKLHTPADDRTYLESVIRSREVWVAETPQQIVGFIAFTPTTIDHLYVDIDFQDGGIGTTLLGWAFRDDAERDLWAFQRNTRAIAFYESRGFSIVERTDGAGNEERMPDVRMRGLAVAPE